MNIIEFEKELTTLINKHSIESGSDTPDFILSHFLVGCLEAFSSTCKQREKWYGRIGLPANPPATASINIMGTTTGKSIIELYKATGGIPIKKNYTEEIKERDNK